jgi:sugar lactone lactonase YvrE
MRTTDRVSTPAILMLVLAITTFARGAGTSVDAHAAGTRVETLAGGDEPGDADGQGMVARFNSPAGIAVDGAGVAFVVDGNRVRRVSLTGEVLTIAGSVEPGFADGPAATARFNGPQGIAVDTSGTLYVADSGNHRIRVLSPQGDVMTLAGSGSPGLADGPGAQAQFNSPYDVAVDRAGTVYVADTLNYRIRRIAPDGTVTTLAGGGPVGEGEGDYADGPGDAARFAFATGIAVDEAGTVYVADTYNARIRAISPAGEVTTIAGSGEDGGTDGPAALARFSDPAAVAVDGSGTLYVVDKSNRIRMIAAGGDVSTLAGGGEQGFADGPAATSEFNAPEGVAVGANGDVYIADAGNYRIRVVTGSAP